MLLANAIGIIKSVLAIEILSTSPLYLKILCVSSIWLRDLRTYCYHWESVYECERNDCDIRSQTGVEKVMIESIAE